MTHELQGPQQHGQARAGEDARTEDTGQAPAVLPSKAHDGAPLSVAHILGLQRTAGNQAVSGLVQRVIGGTTPDRPAAESTRIDVTGRYETTGDQRIMLQINQAGQHLEGQWQQHTYFRPGTPQNISRQNISGTLDSESGGTVTFYVERTPAAGRGEPVSGTLTATREGTDGVSLVLRESSREYRFSRYSSAARLSPQAIAAMPSEVRGLVTAVESAPLDSGEEEVLRALAEDLTGRVAYYLEAPHGVVRTARALAVNREVGEIMGVFPSVQRPLAVRRLRGYLGTEELESGASTRSVWDWLQIMVLSHRNPSDTGHLQEYLGMTAQGQGGADAPQHRYQYIFSVVGLAGDVGIGLGGFLGVFRIRKLGEGAWEQRYFTVMGQVSGGASAGVQVGQTSMWTDFESPFPWSSGNFAGPYSMVGGAGGAAAVGGGTYGAGMLMFYGDHTFPPLAADAGGFQVVYGLYAGAEVSETGGYLWGGRHEAIRDAQSRRQPTSAESRHQASAAVHFQVNNPSLSAIGRQAIREACATHRAALESPASTLRVDGYTSTTGSEQRNQTLSELRAQNVLQAIKDILGEAYRIPDDRSIAEGHGETAARRAGLEDNTESDEWRRVDVTINGSVVLVLHSA